MKSLLTRPRAFMAIAMLGLFAASAGAATIDFEDYPSDTVITNQYLSLGVLFSGAAGDPPPRIYDYVGGYGRVLRSHDWYAPMVISFVDPGNPNNYSPVSYIAFDNPVDSEVDYIAVNVYDQNDGLVYQYLSTSPEYVVINLGSAIAAYMVLDDAQNTAYIIDDLTFEGGVTAVEAGTWSDIKSLFR